MHHPGVPLALEKLEGPATSIIFLGITLYIARMEIKLPQVKLFRIQESLFKWLGNKSATKKIPYLVGLLWHAARAIRCRHTFMAWMHATAAKVKELYFFTRLDKEFQSDIAWWHDSIQCWNGLSMFHKFKSPSYRFIIHTNASSSWDCMWCLHEWTMAAVGMT